MDKAAATFSNLDEEEELLTRQRHAKGVMEAMEKVEGRKTGVENCYEALIGHLHGMKRDDFDPATDPIAVADSAEFSCQERIQEAESKLAEYEDCIKRAEKTLSQQLQLENVVHCPFPPKQAEGPAPTSALPIFRGQSDISSVKRIL